MTTLPPHCPSHRLTVLTPGGPPPDGDFYLRNRAHLSLGAQAGGELLHPAHWQTRLRDGYRPLFRGAVPCGCNWRRSIPG